MDETCGTYQEQIRRSRKITKCAYRANAFGQNDLPLPSRRLSSCRDLSWVPSRVDPTRSTKASAGERVQSVETRGAEMGGRRQAAFALGPAPRRAVAC